jgi:hypothetical protein
MSYGKQKSYDDSNCIDRFMEWAMGIEPNPNLEKAWIQSLSRNRAIADVKSRTDRLRAK